MVVARRQTMHWAGYQTEEPPLVPLSLPWYRRVQWHNLLFPPFFLFKLVVGKGGLFFFM